MTLNTYTGARIAIMQPTYLPWLGYFELMNNCDLFVFLDDVQFVKKSWHQRNKIKTPNGELLLTVPVLTKGKREQLIKDVEINNMLPWPRKHLVSIEKNYQSARFYEMYVPFVRKIFSQHYSRLLALNIKLIQFLKAQLGIETQVIFSSDLNVSGDGSNKIVNICKACKASTLYDAEGAAHILDMDLFRLNNTEVVFQKYIHPIYTQLHGEFISHMSTLDLLFNMGKESLSVLRSTTQASNVKLVEK